MLIDIQNDYFPNGNMELHNSNEACENAASILNVCRDNDMHIIHVQHLSLREDAGFFVPNTAGADIHPSVSPQMNEKLIQKHSPNSFLSTDLDEYLKENNINELIICGMMSHMCIDATVRAAKDKGYAVKLIHDACATKELSFEHYTVSAEDVHHAIMAALNNLYATLYSTSEFLEVV